MKVIVFQISNRKTGRYASSLSVPDAPRRIRCQQVEGGGGCIIFKCDTNERLHRPFLRSHFFATPRENPLTTAIVEQP
jgi:hypothetical protein